MACDRFVAEALRVTKTKAVAEGNHLDPGWMMTKLGEHRHVIRYLTRALVEGTPHTNELIDEMVDDAERYTEQAVAAGLVRPSVNPRARVVVLFLWSMGILVLHEHLERLLGTSLTEDGQLPVPYLQAVMEIYSQGVLTEGTCDEFRQHLQQGGTTPQGDEKE